MLINLHIKMKKVKESKGTHAAYEDVLFHENDELQTEKIDKNKRLTTFTSYLYVANCDSNASIGVTLHGARFNPRSHHVRRKFYSGP